MTACGGGAEEESTETEEQVDLPYEQGGAQTAESFYYGVLDDIVAVDNKLRYVQDLDLIDASADSINTELDSMNQFIAEGRQALDHYGNQDWVGLDSMINLSNMWLDGAEDIVNDYFIKLAEPMSRPDESWSDEEKAIYAEYETAIYDFYEIDEKWVLYQATFAKENGFQLNEEIEPIPMP